MLFVMLILLTNCFLKSNLLVMNLRVRIVQLFSDILADRTKIAQHCTSDTLSDLGKREFVAGDRRYQAALWLIYTFRFISD